jgi:hypothetical protein
VHREFLGKGSVDKASCPGAITTWLDVAAGGMIAAVNDKLVDGWHVPVYVQLKGSAKILTGDETVWDPAWMLGTRYREKMAPRDHLKHMFEANVEKVLC